MSTELRNTQSQDLDQLSILEILQVMNSEDYNVLKAIEAVLAHIAQAVEVVVDRLGQGGRLIYVGAGTSGRLGVIDAVECVPTFGLTPGTVQGLLAGGDQVMTKPIEDAEDNQAAGRDEVTALNLQLHDVVVGIAASGRTPYVIGALEVANELGLATIAISCNAPAPILELAQVKIAAIVGPEVLTGSTRLKAGTAQKLILNMISTASMAKLGKVYGNLMVDVQPSNIKLVDRATRIVSDIAKVPYEQAKSALEQANLETKTAVVIAALNLSPDQARQKLAEHRGFLRPILAN